MYVKVINIKTEGKHTDARRGQHCPCWMETPGGEQNSLQVIVTFASTCVDKAPSKELMGKVKTESWEPLGSPQPGAWQD